MHSRRSLACAVAAVLAFSTLLAACGSDDQAEPAASTPVPTPTATSTSGPATASLESVLRRAVQEERHVKATYDGILAALGQVRPFVAIAKSEGRHINALETVAAAHNVDLRAIVATAAPSPATLAAACDLGVEAEKADVALYDELLPQVQTYPDVVRVLTNLRAASKDSHLPAFQRC